ncbi:MAG TPA: MBL fold metallo-hydrolase [Phycisphaerae bacterium]|nr:MBL fold metallo-hydrolase [Phycisphaerae bacterium]
MRTFSLQSGSNGNCIYVESDGVALLFDAGISGLQAQRRLADRNRDIRRVAAVILSHDHVDHVRCAGIYQRKFGLPIYTTRPTFRRIGRGLGRVDDVRHFAPGDRLDFGSLTVETLRTSHDAVDGAAFVVEDDGKRLGILTDLGHPFAGLPELIGRLDAAYLESNYDPKMLENGPYPASLKARIRGRGGHLSNIESAHLARTGAGKRLQWVAVAHLSEQNNTPELAIQTHRHELGRQFTIHWASRYGPSEWLCVE